MVGCRDPFVNDQPSYNAIIYWLSPTINICCAFNLYNFIIMDLDFHKVYDTYTNAVLLLIGMQPEKYQPAAVAAAEEILRTRTVTQADIDEAEVLCRNSEATSRTMNGGSLQDTIKRFFSGTDKWANVILTIALLQYLRLLYVDMMALGNVIACKDCPFRLVSILSYVDLVYLPIVFFLFYKRKRWGWILMLVSKLFPVLPYFHYYFTYQLPRSGPQTFPSFLLYTVLTGVLLGLLWRQDVVTLFRVSKRTMWGAVLAVAVMLSLAWLS